jgi:plastocyanin
LSTRAAWSAAACLLCAAWALAGCGGSPPAPSAPAGEPAPAGPPAPAAASASGQSAPAGQTGSVAGRVKFAGAAPKPGRIEVTKDTAVCGAHPIVHEEMLVGSDGGLENVVVSIQGAPAGGVPGKYTTELHQTGCVYHPHVSVVAAGQPLAVFNDDGILHNIHTYSTLNPAFNKAQPKFQKRIEVKFDKSETIKVICDAHPWMSAWIVVTDHPYVGVSDPGGAFRLDGLPPGTYTARLWHEKLGERTQPVEVRAGQTSDLAVEFR